MSDSAIREAVHHYIARTWTLKQLELALPDGWQLDKAGDPSLKRLTFEVMGLIGEFDRGDIAERTLRKRLLSVVGSMIETSYSAAPTSTVTNSPTASVFAAGTALPVGSG